MTKANSLSRWLAAAMAALMLLALLPARVWAAESTAYDTDGATAFTFTDSAITAKDGDYTGYDIDGTALTIEAAGTYIVSGSCHSGSITVKKGVTGVTLVLSGLNLLFGFTAPILFALLMDQIGALRFKKLVQTASYMPYFISTVVVAGMVISFIDNQGLVTNFLTLFGFERQNYRINPDAFPATYTITNVWKGFGFGASSIFPPFPPLTRACKLTLRMLNELIEKIEVFNAEKVDGVWEQRLRIHYNCVGVIEIPDLIPLPTPEVSVNTRKGVVVNYAPSTIAG